MLYYIQHEQLETVWPQVAPLIEPSLAYADSKYSLDSVKQLLETHQAQLWVDYHEGYRSAGVTQIIDYPDKKVCLILFIGGGDLAMYQRYLPIIEIWAMENGCQAVEVIGRAGWGKVLPDYERIHVVLRKSL